MTFQDSRFNFCLNIDGNVYTFGDGSRGQLGNGENVQSCKRPELVEFFKKKTVIQIAAGECQTAFVTGKKTSIEELFWFIKINIILLYLRSI